MLWGSIILISLLATFYSLCLKKVQKQYIRNNADFFNFIFYLNLFQAVFLLLLPPYDMLSFSRESLLFGSAFGIIILVYYLFMILAIARGPLVLTNSILALYLIIPIIYGLFFWDESLSVLVVVGLVLFLASILLITNATYFEHNTEKKIELKWLVLVLIAFACSGATSVISKQFAMIRPDDSKEYLLVCRWTNMLAAGIVYLVTRMRLQAGRRQASRSQPDRTYLLLSMAAGAAMALANTLFMNVVTSFSSAFFFPATQAFSIMLMFVFSRLIFKERLSRKALAGYGLIALAIMIISLG
ncbi:MAG: EamA family transporter [Bacillota bacterium]|nr:EamA family transporter [Bacillota bacterium]